MNSINLFINKSFTKSLSLLTAISLLLVSLWADHLYSQSERDRKISIHNIHTKETLTVTYKVAGKYVPSALEKINHIMRDWRRNESRVMRKDLIDLLWEIHDELGSKKPIYLISGYRSRKTNNKLRKTRGGQARFSRHILGMAADVHFPDIPVRELRDSALIRERGGVGYYPTSGLPFVHMDVGRVRHWPRLARPQLASLFPSGRTKHRPRGGRPITKADAKKYGAIQKIAKMKRVQLARRLSRDSGKDTAIAVAVATPPVTPPLARAELEKKLAALSPKAPALARKDLERKLAALSRQNRRQPPANQNRTPWWRSQTIAGLQPAQIKLEEEQQLVQLASIDETTPAQWQSFTPREEPEVIEEDNIAYSPEYDEEHPEEFNYRPFSLSPLITENPIASDENIAQLSPPDYAQSSILLKDNQTYSSSYLRPGLQHAHMRFANQFIGFAAPAFNNR